MNDWQIDAEKGWNALSWEGEAQWFAKKDHKVLGGRLRGLDALIGTIRNAEALRWNLYLNANPTRHAPGKKKLSREDVTHWRYAVVDLDPAGDVLQPPQPGIEGPADNPCRREAADQWLKTASRIFSGRGYQYWLPTEGPLEIGHLASSCTAFVEPLNPGAVELVMQGFLRALQLESLAWCPGWKVDPTCSDLARVVRCPGSVNQRTGKRAVFEKDGGKAVPLDHFRHFARYVPVPPPKPEHVDSENLLGILPHLNVRAKTFILEGAEAGGRHRACYATCKTLHELGVPPQRALDWLLIGAGRSDLSMREVQKIMKQVYGEEA